MKTKKTTDHSGAQSGELSVTNSAANSAANSVTGVTVTVNGEPMRLVPDAPLTQLLDRLAVRGAVAIEVNGELVPRSQLEARYPQRHDQIEIVTLAGGG